MEKLYLPEQDNVALLSAVVCVAICIIAFFALSLSDHVYWGLAIIAAAVLVFPYMVDKTINVFWRILPAVAATY